MAQPNPFNTLRTFSAGGKSHKFYSLPALAEAGFAIGRLPVSIRLVLESLLRNCDGLRVSEPAVKDLAGWKAKAPRTEEIPFVVARIVLQDFTGVPLLVDLAAMRAAAAKLGKNPKVIEPLVPVDLVVDHSVQVDVSGTADSFARNLDIEFKRNRERYQFLKWGMQAFDTFKVVPPGIGIVHQVNLEYLAQGVLGGTDGVYYPDTLVGTDSHTTMINGLGIVGWGVGGIEAEAGMLGQPVYFLTPDVVGVNLTGALREGVTATDLALTLTQLLRSAKVVGKFVEFYGTGAAALPVVDRATIANMAPEYGATMGFFPIDAECSNYLRATGRAEEHVALYEAYYKAQAPSGRRTGSSSRTSRRSSPPPSPGRSRKTASASRPAKWARPCTWRATARAMPAAAARSRSRTTSPRPRGPIPPPNAKWRTTTRRPMRPRASRAPARVKWGMAASSSPPSRAAPTPRTPR